MTTAGDAAHRRLEGRKIGILLENDFAEYEIFYYQHRFTEEGAELHFLTRLWGHERLTFKGHERQYPFDVFESFEGMDDATLASYDALIVPGGYVADHLRFTEDPAQLPPATELLRRAFANQDLLKGINCHGMWLVSSIPEVVRCRRVVAHVNLLGDVRNMGCQYVDEDVVVDGDLVTGRAAAMCGPFAHRIIGMLETRRPAPAMALAR
jgi:protease I